MKNLYLDIDGVLLTKDGYAADYAIPFIEFITDNYDCYWLTTHCKGNSDTLLLYLSKYLDICSVEKLRKLKSTNWETLKTEAINFQSEFLWIDDYVLDSEMNVLRANSSVDRLILVNLSNWQELKRITEVINYKMSI